MKKDFDIREVEISLKEFKKLADEGSTNHQEKLGIYYWIKADMANTEKYLELAANNGSVSAMVMLAEFYENPPVLLDRFDEMHEVFENDETDNCQIYPVYDF